MKKLISLLLALAMLLSLAACGEEGGTSSNNNPPPSSGSSSEAGGEVTGDVDNGDGTYTNNTLGYTYGDTFYSDEKITYTMFMQDNAAYPYKDTWASEDGIFGAIEKATNVHLDVQVIDFGDYANTVALALADSSSTPYIIPKIYSETSYIPGGGIVAVSDYTQYMPNYTNFVEDYDMQPELDTLTQQDGKYYRLAGLKETALQDYTLLVRKDLFDAAGIDVVADENDWTWDEFVDDLIKVKDYMVSQGLCGANDYIWSDMWCGETGSNQGGALLSLMGTTFGIYSGWSITGSYGLIFDAAADEWVDGSISENYKAMMTVVQKLLDNKILDPETFTQQDDTANNKFYRGETALISTNRAQYTAQEEGIKAQLGEGNYELYRIVIPVGTADCQTENSRLECGLVISTNARNSMTDDEFIRLMRFVDWLWYSEAGLTLTKWGVEGQTYTVNDGVYSLTDGFYCGGLTIPQSSDDQVDMRLEYGFACGNFMYGGSLELLTSNYDEGLRNFYDRMAEYRTLRPLDPTVAMSEDDQEMVGMYGTNLSDTVNTWTLKFAMGQADIEDDWDTYVAAVEAANLQNVLDIYNTTYKASK